LVKIFRNDVCTDTFVIADGTKNRHINIKELVKDYERQFLELGTLSVSNRESTGGRPEQYYNLNEPQASFLITLLRNNDIVVDFKLKLVKEFYRMRKVLAERQTEQWQYTRNEGKQTRRKFTDCLKGFIDYAVSQGSGHAERYYNNFSTLIDDTAGITNREYSSVDTLKNVEFTENLIADEVKRNMDNLIYYKDIYQRCKEKCRLLKQLLSPVLADE
jgi:phage regulator Rha-like protein